MEHVTQRGYFTSATLITLSKHFMLPIFSLQWNMKYLRGFCLCNNIVRIMVSANLRNFLWKSVKEIRAFSPSIYVYVCINELYSKQPGKILKKLSCTSIDTGNKYSPYRPFAILAFFQKTSLYSVLWSILPVYCLDVQVIRIKILESTIKKILKGILLLFSWWISNI